MVTYNHESVVAQALESVLMQETSFPVELVIGEDCSTDRTREIVLEFERQHPGRIRVSDYKENLGAQENYVRVLQACRGEYIAWLDGDDYWTDCHKLQKQVDLLDSRPDLAMCFHAVEVFDEPNDDRYPLRPRGRKSVYGRDDLTRSSLMPSSSAVVRNKIPGQFPDWFFGIHYADWSVWAMLIEHGDIGYLDEVMSVQRRHPGGLMDANRRNSLRLCKVAMQMQRNLIEYFGPQHNDAFVDALYSSYYWLAHAYASLGHQGRARACLRKCLRERGYDPKVSVIEPLKVWCHLYSPWLYRFLRKCRDLLSGLGGIHHKRRALLETFK